MRSIGVALTLVVIAASPLRADGPIVTNVNLGTSMPLEGTPLTCVANYASADRTVLDFNIAYRFLDQLAAGAHVGGRIYAWDECEEINRGRGSSLAFELGVVAQWSKNRFWLATWLGIEDAAPSGGRYLSYAFVAGLDLYMHPSGHRVGVFLDLTNAEGAYDGDQHLTAGIAYRYW